MFLRRLLSHNGDSTTLYAVWKSLLSITCAQTATHATFTLSGTQYIKLTDGNCYTKNSVKTATWANRDGSCPPGTSVPPKAAFDNLITRYGSGSSLYNTTGWFGGYWSSTENGGEAAWRLGVLDYQVFIDARFKTESAQVLCYGS